MNSDPQTTSGSKAMIWIGRVISALIVLGLTVSAVFKFVQPAECSGGIHATRLAR